MTRFSGGRDFFLSMLFKRLALIAETMLAPVGSATVGGAVAIDFTCRSRRPFSVLAELKGEARVG